jgi:hypothetical protein
MQDDNMNQQGGMPNNSSDDNMEHKDDHGAPMGGTDNPSMPATGEGHEENKTPGMPEEPEKGGGDMGGGTGTPA